jgi:pimeloyl-ACP methyl ester carboxylesterase
MKNLLGGDLVAAQNISDSAYFSLKNPGGMRTVGRHLSHARKISQRELYTQRLKQLKMPVLLVSGEYDSLAMPRPGHQNVEISGAGHFPQITHSGETARLIREFSQKLAKAS